jgi:hypothetical protein
MSAPLSLLEALALVPDPRNARGRIHPLVAVLGLTVTALMAGCTSLTAIAQFGRDRGNALAFPLGFRRGKTPNASALGKIFRRLDVTALDTALRTWLTARGATDGHLALDGKTLTGSRGRAVGGGPHHQRAQGRPPVARGAAAGRAGDHRRRHVHPPGRVRHHHPRRRGLPATGEGQSTAAGSRHRHRVRRRGEPFPPASGDGWPTSGRRRPRWTRGTGGSRSGRPPPPPP